MKPQSLQEKAKQGLTRSTPGLSREAASREQKPVQEKRSSKVGLSENSRKGIKKTGHTPTHKRTINRSENDGCDHLL